MRRGIIRIVAGALLIQLQLLLLVNSGLPTDFISCCILFGYGAVGIPLLVAGLISMKNGERSQLILHPSGSIFMKIMLTVAGGAAITLSAAEMVRYFLANRIMTIGMLYLLLELCAGVCLFVYALAYMHKKPSSLFAAAWVFVGARRLVQCVSSLGYIRYMMGYETNYLFRYLFMYWLPGLAAGVLSIVLAVILHKEKFSVRTIKILGWVLFGIYVVSDIYDIIGSPSYLIRKLFGYGWGVVMMLCLCFCPTQSLTDVPKANPEPVYVPQNPVQPAYPYAPQQPQWSQPVYTPVAPAPVEPAPVAFAPAEPASVAPAAPAEPTPPAEQESLFCRKCGKKLPTDSAFCLRCGTSVIR